MTPYHYNGTGVDRGPEAVSQRRSAPGGGKPAPADARPGPPRLEKLPGVLVAGGFTWGDPPAASGRGESGVYADAVTATLKKNPGRWARVRSGLKRRPETKAFRSRGLETRTARDPGRMTYGLWARWPETKKETGR